MNFAHYIKEISRGRDQLQGLCENDAYHLFGAILDGGMPELELGAILMALHMKTETLAELLGFYRALSERLYRLNAPRDGFRPVVLPGYYGERGGANLLPLLALLLRRFGVPVLVHGTLQGDGGAGSAHVFRELGVMPCATSVQAQQELESAGLAFVLTPVLAPGLATLLALRERLGVRNSAHVLTNLIDPFGGDGFRVAGVSDPACLERMREFFLATGEHGLLLQSQDGGASADPYRRPRLEYFRDGVGQALFEAEGVQVRSVPGLPQLPDAHAIAKWVRQVLEGVAPLPMPLANQLACCLYGAGYTDDMNQAKAIVAVEAGSLTAA